jgi:hypothetical protein
MMILAWMHNDSNHIQKNATDVYILSLRNENHPNGFYVYPGSIRRSLALYTARSIIKSSWSTNADAYMQPFSIKKKE